MRFMIILKANEQNETGEPPDSVEVAAMGRFNEQMMDAGILLAMEGLKGSAKGAIRPYGLATG